MEEGATETVERAESSEEDESPRAANRGEDQGGSESTPIRAEVSNYEIVSHYFELAADRLEIPDDIRAVLRSAYREVQVQIPVRL
ncbi:MAG TPA: hypothetical protein VEV43_11210, partial [Actinomycetota bacterium]|nr:hypothetical protein [Actinomycetota bacterium]